MDLRFKWYAFLTAFSSLALPIHYFIKIFVNQDAGILSAQTIPLLSVIIIGGLPLLFKIIIKALKADLGSDLLAAIALVTAVYLKQFLAADLIVLMLASGQALEIYASKKASFALEALAKRIPSKAHKKDGGQTRDIEIDQIKIGDLIAIYPFEICPVDGVIVEGNGMMDESYLTGEPYLLSKAPGSAVLSGAINGENLLVVEASKLAIDSRYAKIMEVMKDAEEKRPHLRRMADQIGAIFAPIALSVALLSWYLSGDVMRFLAVLVVATPCPLLIAVPIAIISAISVAAKKGIIIKDPVVLEQLPLCTTAIFDKTGTLTMGAPEITEIVTIGNFSEAEILQLVASLEQYSRHPLALAIIKEAKIKDINFLQVSDISEKPGHGLKGHISGKEIFVTSRNKIRNSDDENLKQDLLLLPQDNSGLECMVVVNHKIAALIILRDKPQIHGKKFIKHLGPTHHFKKVLLVSGDRESEVKYLADLFDITSTYSSQSPEQKLEIVRKEAKLAPTLFMGDGINDAPALAAATVGLAFGQHNIIASEAAKAVIMENSLVKVDELIHISEYMRKIAFQSAAGGMILSFIGIVFAACGFLPPVSGALLQEAIDVLAILNSLRMIWKKDFNSDIR
ncbi:MAG: putative cation transport ATPase [Rickettsiaceae bacterium]|jgi:heavy metal translocating P-type ATPase|nr:putative cation transport ATPase [Rickettsiaceae bacterium]